MDRESGMTVVSPYPWAPGFYPPATAGDRPQVVTSRFQYDDAHTLDRYHATGGYEGLKAALAKTPAEMSEEVKKSTLLGRGGAGFPAGTKWGFTPQGVWPRYLVVNGDESEPGTYKDRLLMECDPHQLIEGCLIACYAAGLSQCFLYIRGEMPLAHERVAQALNDAYAAGYVGKNILGTDFSVDIVLHWGAGAYVVGEETALIESLEGERGMPRLKPPYFPAAVGLYGQPTIVNNVETLSNLPFIAREGSSTFTTIGTDTSPGTRMIAVSGHVVRPGVYEIVNGSTTFRDLLYGDDFAQGIRDGNDLKCFVPGGGSAPWFLPDQLDIPFEGPQAGAAGSMLGSGAVMVMDSTTDIPAAALTLVKFYAHESCGKCVPCRVGSNKAARILTEILERGGSAADVDERIDQLEETLRLTSICGLGQVALGPVLSVLRMQRDGAPPPPAAGGRDGPPRG